MGLFEQFQIEDLENSERQKWLLRIGMPMRDDNSLVPAVQKKPSQPGKNPGTGKSYPSVPTGKGFDLTEKGLPDPVKQKLTDKWLTPLGLDRKSATQNLRNALAKATPEHWAKGEHWYDEVH